MVQVNNGALILRLPQAAAIMGGEGPSHSQPVIGQSGGSADPGVGLVQMWLRYRAGQNVAQCLPE